MDRAYERRLQPHHARATIAVTAVICSMSWVRTSDFRVPRHGDHGVVADEALFAVADTKRANCSDIKTGSHGSGPGRPPGARNMPFARRPGGLLPFPGRTPAAPTLANGGGVPRTRQRTSEAACSCATPRGQPGGDAGGVGVRGHLRRAGAGPETWPGCRPRPRYGRPRTCRPTDPLYIRMTAVAVAPEGAVRPTGGGHSGGRCHVRYRGCRCRASVRRRAYRA